MVSPLRPPHLDPDELFWPKAKAIDKKNKKNYNNIG
jgi:hypothetical protein